MVYREVRTIPNAGLTRPTSDDTLTPAERFRRAIARRDALIRERQPLQTSSDRTTAAALPLRH
jgi:hypothetical protein